MRQNILLLFFGYIFLCCKHTLGPLPPPPPEPPGNLQDARMGEISGISASLANQGLWYVHNDSGDTSRFFAITPGGKLKAIIYFQGNPSLKRLGVTDCEDMAVSTGPQSGASYVYMGDIGDNSGIRKYITVFRMKEPVVGASDSILRAAAEPLLLKYPDKARDAETLMADPIDKLLYIVSKREDSVIVYCTPMNFAAGDTVILQKKCKLYFPGFGQTKYITGGNISQDGQQVLLKSYLQVFYWKRKAHEAIWQTLQRSASVLPYTIEPQGEAIGFSKDGKYYYTVSEGAQAKIYSYNTPGN